MLTLDEISTRCVFLRNGSFSGERGNNLEQIFARAKSEPAQPLLIWFHGGLVTEEVGLQEASDLVPQLEPAFQTVYFIWNSGIADELPKALLHLFGKSLFSSLLENIESFLSKRLGIAAPHLGIAAGPASTPQTAPLSMQEKVALANMIRSDGRTAMAAQSVSAQSVGHHALGIASTSVSPKTPELYVDSQIAKALAPSATANTLGFGIPIGTAAIVEQIALHGVAIATRTASRLSSHRDHGLKQTIIEEILKELKIGGQIWDEMKQDAVNAFNDDPSIGGGTAFLQALKQHLEGSDRQVVLVGHSTGAIYICNFLKQAEKLGIAKQFDVVFLAAAATHQLLAQTIQDNGTQIGKVRFFGMQDPKEHAELLLNLPPFNNVGLKNLYEGSLLYFVSGTVEVEDDAPLVGMQRYQSLVNIYPPIPFPAVQHVCSFVLSKDLKAFVWSPSIGTAGYESSSVTHSGFASDPPTLRSILSFREPPLKI